MKYNQAQLVFDATLVEAHRHMITRYLDVIEHTAVDLPGRGFMLGFCDSALLVTNSDKLSRWVGFIQGYLFVHNLINIDVERDYSRPLYKNVYDALGFNSETVDVMRR